MRSVCYCREVCGCAVYGEEAQEAGRDCCWGGGAWALGRNGEKVGTVGRAAADSVTLSLQQSFHHSPEDSLLPLFFVIASMCQ